MASPNFHPPHWSPENPLYDFKTYKQSSDYLLARLPAELKSVDIGVVCGSGLGGLASLMQNTVEFNYKDIPHFAVSTTPGHAGKLVFGFLSGRKVVAMVGRKHLYEGHAAIHTTYPIRIMSQLGVKTLILTNAAGGLNPDFRVGEFMVISDHVSLGGMSGLNPLLGPNINEFGTRFPATSDAYSFDLRVLAFLAAKKIGLPTPADGSAAAAASTLTAKDAAEAGFGRGLREGVYCYVGGPSFESRAEARFLRDAVGGDVVGMSTVAEVVIARHCGMKVLGMSLVTNSVATAKSRSAREVAEGIVSKHGGLDKLEWTSAVLKGTNLVEHEGTIVANHEEVLETGMARVNDFQDLVVTIIGLLPPSDS